MSSSNACSTVHGACSWKRQIVNQLTTWPTNVSASQQLCTQ